MIGQKFCHFKHLPTALTVKHLAYKFYFNNQNNQSNLQIETPKSFTNQ